MYVCSALHIQWRSNLPVVAGIFYALTLHIYGFVPPCRCLMARLPLSRCSATGKAEPFFYFRPANIFSYAQTYSEMFERERYIPFRRSKSLAKGSRSFAANETYTISIRNPEAHRSNIRPRDAYASGCDRPGYGKSRIF